MIAPAQFRRIDAGLIGGEIDQPLDHIGGFRPAIAAIRPHRVGVRIHGGHVGMNGGRAIDAGQRAEIVEEVRRAGLQVSAHIGDGFHPHADERAVTVERKLGVGDVVARLGVAEKGLRARAQPFDRAAGQFRCKQHQRRLVEDRRLHAEAAADIAGNHVHLALGNLQHVLCEVGSEDVHALRLGVERVVPAGRVVVADAPARLHRHGRDAIDHQAMADDVVRARERRVRRRLVARKVNEADVVRQSSQTRRPGDVASAVEVTQAAPHSPPRSALTQASELTPLIPRAEIKSVGIKGLARYQFRPTWFFFKCQGILQQTCRQRCRLADCRVWLRRSIHHKAVRLQ